MQVDRSISKLITGKLANKLMMLFMPLKSSFKRDYLDVSRWWLTKMEKGDEGFRRVWKVEKEGIFLSIQMQFFQKGIKSIFQCKQIIKL